MPPDRRGVGTGRGQGKGGRGGDGGEGREDRRGGKGRGESKR